MESKSSLSPIEEIVLGEQNSRPEDASVEIVPGNSAVTMGSPGRVDAPQPGVAVPVTTETLSGVLDKVVESNSAIASLISNMTSPGTNAPPVYIATARSSASSILSEEDALQVIRDQLKNAVSAPLSTREVLLRLARLVYLCLVSGTTLTTTVLHSSNHAASYVPDEPEAKLQDIIDGVQVDRDAEYASDPNLEPDQSGLLDNPEIENLPVELEPVHESEEERDQPGASEDPVDIVPVDEGNDSEATVESPGADVEYTEPRSPHGDADQSDDSTSSHIEFVDQRFAASDVAAAPEAIPRRRTRVPANQSNSNAATEAPRVAVADRMAPRPSVVHALLTIGDGGKWDARATERAAFWTRQLREARAAGRIGDDEWDGQDITPKQWNERTGTAYLRELFTRDRNNVYQAHRREMIRGNITEAKFDPFSQKGSVPTEPVEGALSTKSRKRKMRAISLRPMRALPSRIDERTVVIPAAEGMDAGLQLSDILRSMDPQKTFRVGKGLLDNSIHRRIMRVHNVPAPMPRKKKRSVPGNGTMIRQELVEAESCARAALEVLLFFANPEHGDAIIQGSSDVVYQLSFDDIFNLFRLQPELIPKLHKDKFVDSPSTANVSTIKRWNSKSVQGKFADSGRRIAKEAQQGDDFFKVIYLAVNALVQLVVNEIDPASADHSDVLNSQNLLRAVLGMEENERTQLVATISATLDENIDSFLRHAGRRLSLRRDV